MREYGLDAIALVQEVEKLLGAKLNITEEDLAAVRLEAMGFTSCYPSYPLQLGAGSVDTQDGAT